jgi:hypothetical protein
MLIGSSSSGSWNISISSFPMREATRFTEGFPLGPSSTLKAKNREKRHKEKLNFFAIAHQYFSNNTPDFSQ